MPVSADKVVVELEARLDKYNARVQGAERQFSRSMNHMSRDAILHEKQIDALAARYHDLGAGIRDGLLRASRLAQVSFAAISAYSVKLAMDAAEIENAFDVAFGSSAASARAFSEELATSLNRDAVPVREAMSRLQLVITGVGVASEESSKLVQSLASRAIDIGSLFKVKDTEAFAAIISGITGETEPLKRFGVVLNETAVKAELLRLGFRGNAEQASEAAKAVARTNIILRQTAVAQGDAAKTADGAANKAKAMRDQFNVAARDLGQQLIPAFIKLASGATDALQAFNQLPDGVQAAGLAFLALIAAGGPIAGLMANLGKLIKLANDTRTALAGVAGASAAAGGGAAAGTLLGGALRLGGVATAPLILSGDTRPQNLRQELDRLRDEAKRIPNRRGFFDRDAALKKVNARIAEIEAFLAAEVYGAGSGSTPNATETDTSVVGGFSLSPAQKVGSVGAGGKTTPKGPTEEELKAMRVELTLQHQLEVARARGDDAQIQALEDKLYLLNEIEKLTRAGVSNAPAAAQTQLEAIQSARRQAARAKLDELVQESVDAQNEAQKTLADEHRKALFESTRDGIIDGLYAASQGDILEYLAARLKQTAFESFADGITRALQGAGEGSGGGNFLDKAISVGARFLGFGRAAGGNVVAGVPYQLNEKGHLEGFVPAQSGRVIPLGNVKAAGRGGGSVLVLQTLQFNPKGAVMTADLLAQMEAMSARSMAQAVQVATQIGQRGAPGRFLRYQELGT